MLLKWVIGIITWIITYNIKGFILQDVQGCVNRGILWASLTWKAWYLTDTPPCQYMVPGCFIVGASHRWKLYVRHWQKFMALSAFPYWVTSGTKQWTLSYKTSKVWRNNPLKPIESWPPSTGKWAFQPPSLEKLASGPTLSMLIFIKNILFYTER